jgi:hypothetical protein
MNKYQKALDRIVSTIIEEEADGYWQPRTAGDFCWESREILQELVNKADSFEWIPVSKKLPDEHDSIFAKLYETDVVNDMLWRTRSKEVLVTIEYENGERTVKSSHTTDGKWWIEKETTLSKFKVIAWMPMPEPYKENEND